MIPVWRKSPGQSWWRPTWRRRSIPKWRRSPGQSWWRPTWRRRSIPGGGGRQDNRGGDRRGGGGRYRGGDRQDNRGGGRRDGGQRRDGRGRGRPAIANNDQVMTGHHAENTKVAMIANQAAGLTWTRRNRAQEGRKPSALKSRIFLTAQARPSYEPGPSHSGRVGECNS